MNPSFALGLKNSSHFISYENQRNIPQITPKVPSFFTKIEFLKNPSVQFCRKRIYPIEDEFFNDEQIAIKERILNFFELRDKSILEPIEREIFAFFWGKEEFDGIENFQYVRKILEIVKIIDLAVKEYNRRTKTKIKIVINSYKLRSKIIEIYPFFTTSEVYTYTLDLRKLKNRDYLKNPTHWVDERVGRQAKLIINQYIKTRSLSNTLNISFLFRGPSGAGKSHYIHEEFKALPDCDRNLKGSLNPDELKFNLKRLQTGLVNVQVHLEGVTLFQSLKDGISNHKEQLNTIVEGRLSSLEEVDAALEYPRQRRKKVFFVDIAHASLLLLLRRILARDPYGRDPCPFSQDVMKGYLESIEFRRRIIDLVEINRTIKFFKLHFVDEFEKCHLVVNKEENKFKILSKELLDRSCKIPSDTEIERQLHHIIDKKDFPNFEKWHGMPIGKAIDQNAAANIAPLDIQPVQESQWGEILVQPFCGKWLNDYPMLVDHIESEHILHIRGSDLDGIGLHWQTKKFSTGLNSKFSPEARVGSAARQGFQMKLGYFLIPPWLIEDYCSTPHKEILNELKDPKTGFYRFFVHPEAYNNYMQLYQQKGVIFVKSNDSEFMGTPTSSYRSFVVRRLSDFERTIPFIVKMGVGDERNQEKFLLKEFILRSLHAQDIINTMKPRHDFFYFRETIGLILKNGMCKENSGLIVREIPKSLLLGECRIFSFSALMSVERQKKENHGLCAILPESAGLGKYPLIYEIIAKAMQRRLVRSPFEFINRYLITKYFQATKSLFFKNGLSFAPHGQNLCFVLNHEGLPLGFAYRDFEGIFERGKNYIESFSWFYRYHCIVKLLNVITDSHKDYFDPLPGAPLHIGCQEVLKERNLYPFIKGSSQNEIYFPFDDYKAILENLDTRFLDELSRYYHLETITELKKGSIPSGEGGSTKEKELASLNDRLWKQRKSFS